MITEPVEIRQLELFRDLFEISTDVGAVPDRFDITEISPFVGGFGTAFERANKKITDTKNLPSNRYFIYKEGYPKMKELPFVKNEKTGIIYSIGDTKHSYPTVGLAQNVWWDMHKLVGHAFVKNPDLSRMLQIDHKNEDNTVFCKFALNTLGFKRAALHMVDFRIPNLRWCTNSQNQKFKYKEIIERAQK